tara:strand:+ start:47 stop:3394 length:3348 start_codon:yes stop_codon:yes gene_type:complete
MSGLTRTTLIECPRSQSDEGLAHNNQNPSQWTNRTGDGINLKPGDTIQVHSSYVSEIGAEAGKIQIKGQSLNASVSVEITNTTDSLFEDELPEKYVLSSASNITKTIDIRDDTLNLVVSPYKSANGEYYAHLPRRWIGDGSTIHWETDASRDNATIYGDAGQTANAPYEKNRCKADINTKYFPYRVGVAHLRHRIDGRNDGSRYTMFRRKQTFFDKPDAVSPLCTGGSISGSAVITLAHGSTTADLLVGMELIGQFPATGFGGFPVIAEVISPTEVKLDIVATTTTTTHNQFTFNYPSAKNADFLPPITPAVSAPLAESFRDPALNGDYIQVRDLISVKANPGYNSPSDLADQLTQEINERTDFEKYEYPTTDTAGTYIRREAFTFKTETDSYKVFNCGTCTNYSKTSQAEFAKLDGTWNVATAYKYLSSYQNIGIKRPELYTSGILVNGPNQNPADPNDYYDGYAGGKNGLVLSELTPMAKSDKIFVTAVEWNKENILRFKAFFDSQRTYPELFDYTQSNYKCNIDETRYVHLNLFDNASGGEVDVPNVGVRKWFLGANARNASAPLFGYDLYNHLVSASQTSYPMFIDYNPDTVSSTENDVGYTDRGKAYFMQDLKADYDDLAYGFARKIRKFNATGEPMYVLGFQFTRTGNKIPDHFFHTNASAQAGEPAEVLGVGNRQFGYDFHFSAYGSAAMILYNGNATDQAHSFASATGDSLWTTDYRFSQATTGKVYKLEPYQFGMYLGAEEPQIKYNDEQGRFQISDFHTSEKVGNLFDASFLRPTVSPDAPSNPDADVSCYKINKRMLRWNYCPEMIPYTDSFVGKSTTSASDNAYISHNVAIDTWSIMDAQSGLFIEDWVVPENLWDESLVGIMGYRYDQFHNPNSQSSRQVRLKASGANAQLNNVNIITTNAIVSEGDIGAYQQNTVGAKQISPVLTVAVQPAGTGFTVPGRYITPAITVSPVQSVNITAERLPSKTLRPYYTIRSDIISEPNQVIGGLTSGITMPIVAITNKANPFGDFLNGFQGQETFTNTTNKTITRIRCSIHEPDGSAARCDNNSAVIFKINQQIDANLDLVGELMQSKKKSDQLLAEQLEEPELEYQNVKYKAKELFE